MRIIFNLADSNIDKGSITFLVWVKVTIHGHQLQSVLLYIVSDISKCLRPINVPSRNNNFFYCNSERNWEKRNEPGLRGKDREGRKKGRNWKKGFQYSEWGAAVSLSVKSRQYSPPTLIAVPVLTSKLQILPTAYILKENILEKDFDRVNNLILSLWKLRAFS